MSTSLTNVARNLVSQFYIPRWIPLNDGLHMVVILEENEADKNDVLRHNRGSDRQYVFDAVFGENSTQEMIFERTTKGLVKDVLEGYNSTIFAYGASGSGKTHTMLGTTTEPGIMVRALHEIFSFVKNNALPQNFNVTMSYLEIYNENIRDLLNPDSGFLELREDQKEKTVRVVRLTEVSTNSTEEVRY
ncbi:hypothetical protein RUM44_010710 [Polyplax serrata]|uniref:Kinesin motor domain-containing protein n=1 Tax=Polyplax serrata TaxID=468196 RepID=A0ABR1APH9_POLSC